MPIVQSIIETALYVKDLQASAAFYRDLFGFPTLLKSDRLIALDVAGRSVLLLFKQAATTHPYTTPNGTIPGHGATGPSHLAFSITPDALPDWQHRLAAKSIPLESTMTWPAGAQSLYFRDPDHHLIELLTPGFWRTY